MDRRKFMGTLATMAVAGASGLQLDFMDGTDKKSNVQKGGLPKRESTLTVVGANDRQFPRKQQTNLRCRRGGEFQSVCLGKRELK